MRRKGSKLVLFGLFFVMICALCVPAIYADEPIPATTVDPGEIYGKWEVVITGGAAISNSGKKSSFSDHFYVVFDHPQYEYEYWYAEGKLYE